MKLNYLFNRNTIVSALPILRKFTHPLVVAYPVPSSACNHSIVFSTQTMQANQAPKGYLCV